MNLSNMLDVVIVGGSYAGLSAALSLGRAIQSVVIIDSGEPCNRQTPHSHNFLTQDGSSPAGIAAEALQQILKYPTVHHVKDKVSKVQGHDHHFVVKTTSGSTFEARKILFATGIRDLLPDIPGMSQCWGISVIHCPYCHGYEYRGKQTGIMMNGDEGAEHAVFIRNWAGQLTLFTQGKANISAEKRALLTRNQIRLNESPIRKIVHKNGYISSVELADGTSQALDALYARVPFEQHCSIPQILGCAHTPEGFIQVDAFNRTTIPGIFAAGDNVNSMRSVSQSVAGGTMAGAMLSRELIMHKNTR
ncbi:NAD(P)/FAD-dependent oxidoreductase [Dyadobacter sandarakinus]|uniref:NAD(P)/FAD-dependent oxidoreductase n=1 Tax=Dyadobacter sandarakinus TaxID=2747268 RepID=A0ABX7I832_9BACT|nr:NAD(P)/FAD-dependent oxidoreductase [Dyadobacter sandarakinus]QRR01632.1 NAD(P)/FAD-dependent oxidoreductase [Dyadobacter sandarakinus]